MCLEGAEPECSSRSSNNSSNRDLACQVRSGSNLHSRMSGSVHLNPASRLCSVHPRQQGLAQQVALLPVQQQWGSVHSQIPRVDRVDLEVPAGLAHPGLDSRHKVRAYSAIRQAEHSVNQALVIILVVRSRRCEVKKQTKVSF